MQIALIHKYFGPAHLEAVKAEMMVMGAPVIKAVWMECYGAWAALEGCHRIRAAQALGLIPEIEEIEYSDEITTEELGLDFGGDVWTVAEIADGVPHSAVIHFED